MVPVGTMSLLYGTYRYQQAGPVKMSSSDGKDPAIPGKLAYRASGSAPRGLTRSLVIDVAMPSIAVQLLSRVWGVCSAWRACCHCGESGP